MSEEPKITSVEKTKDPRRVEAGRRLAMISKQAKERKARETAGESCKVVDEWGFITVKTVGVVGGVVIAGLVLYNYSRKKTSPEPVDASVNTCNVEPIQKTKRIYKELDTLD